MYNRNEIEKNLGLFESSLNEVFAKLILDYSHPLLRERAEVTLELADHVKYSLERYKNDPYISGVIKKIDAYQLRFDGIKSNFQLKNSDLIAKPKTIFN